VQSSMPLVSIVIPCYNQARFLSDALNSVLAQTYPNWECIIVNDGSKDDTERLANDWMQKDGRVKSIKKINGGLSSARNAGLLMAAGDLIQFLDADDLLEPEKLKYQLNCLANAGDKVDIVVSGYRYFHDSDRERELLIFGPNNFLPEVAVNFTDRKDLVKLFARTNPMVVSAPLYRRGVFERVGNFDETLGALEDWDFHFRCIVSGVAFQHCGYSPQSKTLIRIHPSSMSADRRNMIRNLRRFQQKHRGNRIFVLENGLEAGSIASAIWNFLKMLTPPGVIWLVKRLLGLI
jgi:glycosyltransferase involved in cell wall biosynthesis